MWVWLCFSDTRRIVEAFYEKSGFNWQEREYVLNIPKKNNELFNKFIIFAI